MSDLDIEPEPAITASPPSAAGGKDVLLLGLEAEGDLASFDTVLAPAGYRVRACATIQQAIRLVGRIDPCAGLLRLGIGRATDRGARSAAAGQAQPCASSPWSSRATRRMRSWHR